MDMNGGQGVDAVVVRSPANRHARSRDLLVTVLAPVLTFTGLIVLWWALVTVAETPEYLVPAPQSIPPALVANWDDLWANTQITLAEVFLGFGVTVVFAIPMGLTIALSSTTRKVAYPVLVLIQLVPKIAIAPLFVVWFGFGMQSKVFLTALMTFFPLLLASIAGFQALDPRLLYLSRSMGSSRWQTFRLLRLPSAMPVIFSGLKTAATIAATAAIVAEFVGSNAGLGYRLLVASLYLDTPLIFAILAILTVIGLGMNYLIEAIEYFVMPWKHVAR
ncbi:MAG: ABC transporter permease [Candidatus Limnocylindrales bacterium]